METYKTPPYSEESEQSVLGGLMAHNDAWFEVSDVLTADDFYTNNHQKIFSAISYLLGHGEPADILTVKSELEKMSANPDIFKYLAELVINTPNVSNVVYYANHVRRVSVFRSLIKVGQKIADSGYNPKEFTPNELIEEAEKHIFNLSNNLSQGKSEVVNLKDTAKDLVVLVQDMQENTNKITGLETGFSALDSLTSGLQKSDLIIVAGRPSMGKTAIAMNIVEHVAINNKKSVAVFSLEMSSEQLGLRLISSMSKVSSTKMRNLDMTEIDWHSFNNAVLKLEGAGNILIDDSAGVGPAHIRGKCRRFKSNFPDLSLIVIDYMQLMSINGSTENRVQEISEISRSLKALAKEMEVPVIALSQLNRAVESRPKPNKGRMPQMADLRDSGSIEQDADIIAFVYRDEQYHDDNFDNPDEVGKADLNIAKHRNGPTGNLRLLFAPEYTKFSNLSDNSGSSTSSSGISDSGISDSGISDNDDDLTLYEIEHANDSGEPKTAAQQYQKDNPDGEF